MSGPYAPVRHSLKPFRVARARAARILHITSTSHIALWGVGLFFAACSFDWDAFDPREGSGAGGDGGMPASGGSAGEASTGGAAPGIWTVRPIAELASENDDDDPTFTEDLLELYFNTDRSGAYDIWVSTRADPADPWGAPVEATALNSAYLDNNGVVSADGLSFWVGSQRDGQAALDIYVATRPDRASSWSTPVAVAELNDDAASDYVCSVSPDNITMILNRDNDLYLTTRGSVSDPWDPPVAIATLNSTAVEGGAWLSPDLLTIYFDTTYSTNMASDRNVLMATRNTPISEWGAPASVRDWNSSDTDGDPWLSTDAGYAVFARGAEQGARQLYEALR